MTPERKQYWKEFSAAHAEHLAQKAAREAYLKAHETFKEIQGFGNWFPAHLEKTSLADLIKWQDRLRKEGGNDHPQAYGAVILALIEEEIRDRARQ